MSLASVGSGQHFNIPSTPPPPTGETALYFRYASHLHSFLLLILGVKQWLQHKIY